MFTLFMVIILWAVIAASLDQLTPKSLNLIVEENNLNLVLDTLLTFLLPQNKAQIVAGNDLSVLLDYHPETDPKRIFQVQLQCGTNITIKNIVGNANDQFIEIPSDWYGSCSLDIADPAPGLIVQDPPSILVMHYLTFTQPKEFQKTIVLEPFALELSTNIYLEDAIRIKLTCPTVSREAEVSNNGNIRLVLSFLYIGNCQIGVISAPDYYILPVDVNIWVKYGLSFSVYPLIITNYIPFDIELQPSSQVAPQIQAVTDVSLICDCVLLFVWGNIRMGVPVTLLLPTDTKANNNCLLTTLEDDPNFYEANVPVRLIKSPFGGYFTQMSEEDTALFLPTITFFTFIRKY